MAETMGAAPGHPESQMLLQEVNANGHLENREQPGTRLERDPEAALPENQEPLQEPLANEHRAVGGEPGHRWNYKTCAVTLGVVSLVLLISVIALAVSSSGSCPDVQGPICLDSWVEKWGKCFYFSTTEGNWPDSQNNCSALGASLAAIDNKQEMDNLLHHKDKSDYWIGLRKDQGSTWKWANGTEFNHLFVIGGDGGCAYLNKDIGVSSLRCTSERRWICSKPKALTAAKETPAGRGS